jgi:hypothetical protein
VVRVNDRGDRFAGQARDLRSDRPAVLVARSGVDQDQAVGPAITTLLSGLPMVMRMIQIARSASRCAIRRGGRLPDFGG